MKNPLLNTLYYPGMAWAVLFFAASCHNPNHKADAFGNFEADEVIISAQSQGNLMMLAVTEGMILEKGQQVGKIDTSIPAFKVSQLKAQQTVVQTKLRNMDAQLDVQKEQRINLEREVRRVETLMESAAATRQQFDDLSGKLKVLDLQTETIKGQKNTINAERAVLIAQLGEAENLLQKCTIINPSQGTVLEKYAEAGELVTPGKALYKIANTAEMELKVFVDGSQLSSIAIGDTVQVYIDSLDKMLQSMPGTVNWVSPQAEFTPKIIQTREERVNMVYAVKVRVNNDGRLKIGMPGEVIFGK